MEAKDTVMTYKQRAECSHNPTQELREVRMCEAQAEISFKAGIREVVELDKALMEHILQAADGSWSIESLRLKAFYRRRQAKLKEWGIK